MIHTFLKIILISWNSFAVSLFPLNLKTPCIIYIPQSLFHFLNSYIRLFISLFFCYFCIVSVFRLSISYCFLIHSHSFFNSMKRLNFKWIYRNVSASYADAAYWKWAAIHSVFFVCTLYISHFIYFQTEVQTSNMNRIAFWKRYD